MSYAYLANAYARGDTVRHPWFAAFFFASTTMRVWTGFRKIEVGGQLWQPVGPRALVDSGSIEDPIANQAPSLVLSMSGVDAATFAIAKGERDQYKNRLVYVYDTFLDENWQPYVPLEVYAVARMDTMKLQRKKVQDGKGFHYDRVISLTAEYLLTNGANPVAGRYTTADQRIRHPEATDLYFEFMAANQNKKIRWPTF